MKKLRSGLIDPNAIERVDLPEYMATTYKGYFVLIKQRLLILGDRRNCTFGLQEVDVEFFSLQIRLILEGAVLGAYTFTQQEEAIGSSARSNFNLEKILKKIQKKCVITSFRQDCVMPLDGSGYIEGRQIRTDFSDWDYMKKFYGNLGNLLHEQQRPRPTKNHLYSIGELHAAVVDITTTFSKHLLSDSEGNGWFVDMCWDKSWDEVLIYKIGG